MAGHDDYFLGLPAWAFPGWRDRYFTDKPSRLASYAGVFNTVEGNTTFYRTPDGPTIERWHQDVVDKGFRFCLKLPRGVTHERRPDLNELERFLAAIEPLGETLGPLLVQFPATLGPTDMAAFEDIFRALDNRFRFVIEVRHPAFFEHPSKLEPFLERYSAGRVVLDSRPLYEGDRTHPEVLKALHEKPDVPVVPDVYSGVAFVRLILHPDIDSNAPYISEWADHIAGYLGDDVETYMMIHCPNNLHCPPLAYEFHDKLRRKHTVLAPLASWPVPEQMFLV
ncbi:MAG: DUF72 domain-containing protein [Woeseiaceae bacterium]|nr:DUF72 domain-containing protein [Woeseiaceae bacterium]